MKKICTLFLIGAAFAAVSCTHETPVYVHHTYYRTAYRDRPVYESSPATIPGQPVHLSNPGEPSGFRAETGGSE